MGDRRRHDGDADARALPGVLVIDFGHRDLEPPADPLDDPVIHANYLSVESDLDVLVVVNSDDWRVHKQIRYLAADICLKYSLNLSPRVWSASHRQEIEELQTLLYQNIHRDSINLLGPSPATG